jgi:hypothetical protein
VVAHVTVPGFEVDETLEQDARLVRGHIPKMGMLLIAYRA